MSWSPSINFKLRDDQVAFGNLIFDKNGATLVCEVLQDIKDGKPVNAEVLKNILDGWCFMDSEFEQLKVEFEQIKEDIAKFKQISTSFGSKWTASIKSVGIAVDYIAGSATWVQKYKENKAIAAGLYQQIKKSGYNFSVAEQQEYDKRYWEVMQSSTETELVEAYLQKQYRENLAAGDRDAVRKYCDALVETGCLTPEAARKKQEMLGYFANASGAFSAAERQSKVDSVPTSGRQEPSRNKPVTLTVALMNDWYNEIEDLDKRGFPAEADSALDLLYRIMCMVCMEAEVPTYFSLNDPTTSRQQAWYQAKGLLNILSLPQNTGLVDCADISAPADEVSKMEAYWLENRGSGFNSAYADDDYMNVDADIVAKLAHLCKDHDDEQSTERLEMILSIHNQCDEYAEGIDKLWNRSVTRDEILEWATSYECQRAVNHSCVVMPRKKMNRLLGL